MLLTIESKGLFSRENEIKDLRSVLFLTKI